MMMIFNVHNDLDSKSLPGRWYSLWLVMNICNKNLFRILQYVYLIIIFLSWLCIPENFLLIAHHAKSVDLLRE